MRTWAFAIAFLAAPFAHAAPLLTNLDSTPPTLDETGLIYEIYAGRKAAIGFTAPATGALLESARFTLEMFNANAVHVELREGGATTLYGTSTPAPGVTLAELSPVAEVVNQLARQTYAPPAPIALEPGKHYWLVLSGSSAEWASEIQPGQEIPDPPSGVAGFAGYGVLGNAGIWIVGNYHPGVELTGIIVPEPAMLAILPALFFLQRRR